MDAKRIKTSGTVVDIPPTTSTGNGSHGALNQMQNFVKPLPVEVWEIILNQLTEDEDRTNGSRALPLFDEVLTRSKPVWLFKQVLPFVSEDLLKTKKGVLTCRSICKQWSQDIEHHLTKDDGKHGKILFGEELYSFKSVEDIDRFSQQFEAHSRNGRNPFIHKMVWVEYHNEEFRNRFLELMTQFGKHVWTLAFICGLTTINDEYTFLRQILERTPNLKELSVNGINATIYPGTMAGFPLPKIPTLTYLSLTIWNCRTDELTKPRSWIYMLTGSIKKLDIQYAQENSVICLSRLLRTLQKFPLLEHVDISGGSMNAQLKISRLSHLRNSTVRSLHLELSGEGGTGVPVSCNFLRVFNILEELSVVLKLPKEAYLGRNEGELEIQFYKMLEVDQLYKSNIWMFIPTLKIVRIRFTCDLKEEIFGDREGFLEHIYNRFLLKCQF